MQLYCCSDIHGFYDEFKAALKKSGFEAGNPEHLLVVCGDYFDRGRKPRQLLDYLNTIPNKVLIRGNHEDLMVELWNRGIALGHDVHNGTVGTVNDLVPINITKPKEVFKYVKNLLEPFYEQMVDYFETKNHVFVHGWVPVITDYDERGFSRYRYNRKWRHGDWKGARWLNGMEMGFEGLNKTGKTVICGHWHCSYGHSVVNGTSEFGSDACFEPFIDSENKVIAIDGCVAHTRKVNVMVINDEMID